MSKKAKASPTLVGLFVLGAIVIAVGGIVFFGTTKLFATEKNFVCFFQQSITGLQVGGSVRFKGVPVGQVTKIQIRFNPDGTDYVKIVFSVDADRVVNQLGAAVDLFDEVEGRRQIERGLRATLKSESLITGILYLELDFHPDAPPPVFLQDEKSRGLSGRDRYTEIPTLPSNIEAIIEDASKAMSKLAKIDFEAIGKDLQNLLGTANKGLSEIKFAELSASIKGAADAINGLASSPDTKGAVIAARRALDDLSKTLVGLQKTTGEMNSTLAPEGELRTQLTGTLGQVGEMAESLKRLSEFLERNPNSLIFGRKPSAKTPATAPVSTNLGRP